MPIKKIKFAEEAEKENEPGNKKDCVYFFKMNGCGHCKDLQPIWDKVVSEIRKTHPSIVFMEVESSNITKLDDYTKSKLKADQIMAYPDLRILKKNGDTSTFQSNRTVEELAKWIKNNTSPQDGNRTVLNRVPTPYPRKSKKRTVGGKRRKRLTRRTRRRSRRIRNK